MQKLRERVKNFDVKAFFHWLFPITVWIRDYDLSKLRGDVISGTTVGIMIMPQSIAFASLSGLPPEYGLYSALTPGIVYAIFGTSKDVSVGPTLTMSLFTNRINRSLHPTGASILAFLIGVVLVLMGIFRLGSVANFMPRHVLSGFISAAALTIFSTQLSGLFGYAKAPSNFVGRIVHFFTHVYKPNVYDLVMSICCLIYLIFFMWLSKKEVTKESKSKSLAKKVADKSIWFLCVARSALVCILATAVAYTFYINDLEGLTLAGELPQGLPSPKFPLQSFTAANNKTYTVPDAMSEFGASLIILPTIQFIQSISIAKAFGKIYNYNVDSTQELFALGMANIVGSFFGGWPVCGSFSRSAVNAMSGTRTPLRGAVTCMVIFFGCAFITPIFQYIPKAALSAMIVMAVITMLDIQTPKSIWKTNKIDLIPYLVAFLGTFYKLEAGVLAGALASLILMVSRELSPNLSITHENNDDTVTICFESTPSYPCVETLKESILNLVKQDPATIINVDMFSVHHLDFSVIATLKSLLPEIKKAEKTIIFTNFANKKVHKSFIAAELCGDVGVLKHKTKKEIEDEEFQLEVVDVEFENTHQIDIDVEVVTNGKHSEDASQALLNRKN